MIDASGGPPPVIVAENPSSLPSNSAGNASGFSQLSFQYFPLYVLDENNGIVLFNNQYQQANLNGVIDLYAQVKGTTVSTYSWTTSGLSLSGSSGASTYHFHAVLSGMQLNRRRLDLADGHQLQQPAGKRDLLLRGSD